MSGPKLLTESELGLLEHIAALTKERNFWRCRCQEQESTIAVMRQDLDREIARLAEIKTLGDELAAWKAKVDEVSLELQRAGHGRRWNDQ